MFGGRRVLNAAQNTDFPTWGPDTLIMEAPAWWLTKTASLAPPPSELPETRKESKGRHSPGLPREENQIAVFII